MAPIKTEEESDASMRARLVESLSSSFPGSALSKALHAMDDMASCSSDGEKDMLSSSCFAELRLDKIKVEEMEDEEYEEDDDEEDDELTSLAWLQNNDLLKNIHAGDRSLCTSPMEDAQKENDLTGGGYVSQTHPPHVPYNPQKHINSKPPYSFSCLIFMAVEDSPSKKLPVKDIYNWILTHFPYFQNAPTGWKNSVRHNLSLNKCFKKVEKEKGHGIGKGSLWCIDPDYRPNLLQALRKTPYHPYHQLQMLSNAPVTTGLGDFSVHGVLPINGKSLPLTARLNVNSPSPHLFPFLSRRLAQSGLETGNLESDIDVANTLVSLKRAAESRRPLKCRLQNGERSRSPSPPEFGSAREKQLLRRKLKVVRPKAPVVCTSKPSEDHTYSITNAQLREARSPSSSIDEEYDFGDDDDDEVSDVGWSDTDYDEEEDLAVADMKAGCTGSSLRHKEAAPTRKRMPIDLQSLFKRRRISPASDGADKEREEEDEEKKIVEGADALLNLAGIKTCTLLPLRAISPSSNNNNNNNTIKVEKDLSPKQSSLPDSASVSPSRKPGETSSEEAGDGDGDKEKMEVT